MSGAVEGVALLPCPFCGQAGKAIIGPVRDGAAVCCPNFACLGQVQAFNPNARAKAIAAWNTRTTPPARSYADGVTGEALFRAFMASDVTRLTTTALPEEWPRMQPSYQQAWEDFARLLSQGGKA